MVCFARNDLKNASLWRRVWEVLKSFPRLYSVYTKGPNVSISFTCNFPYYNPETKRVEPALVHKTDTNFLLLLDEKTLEFKRTFRYSMFNKSLNGMTSAAHECIDPHTQMYYNYTGNVIIPGYKVIREHCFFTCDKGLFN